MTPEEKWLEFFNPCGMEIVAGFVHQACPQECEGKVCLRKTSFQAAKYLLQGSEQETETREVEQFIVARGLLNKEVVGPNETLVFLTRENAHSVATEVVSRAKRIVRGVRQSVANTEQLDSLTWEDCSNPLQESLLRVKKLEEDVRIFSGSKTQALALADQMHSALAETIECGGGNLGIIARLALKFGLADQLPAIDTTGLVFVGNIERLQQLK